MSTLRQAAPAGYAGLRDSAVVGRVYPAVPVAVPQARRLLTTALASWGLDGMAGDAALVEAELVSNAVRAGEFTSPPEILVQVIDAPDVVLILVGDHDPAGPPRPRTADGAAEHGRGMFLADALSAYLAWFTEGDWKLVWAAMAKPPAPAEPPGVISRPGHQDVLGKAA